MHLSLLRGVWPRPLKSRRKAVEELGERLGDLNDIFVMFGRIEADGKALGKKKEIALLRRLLKRSEKPLRKACLKQAKDLFGGKRKPKVRKIVDKYRAGAGSAPQAAQKSDVSA
jgi:hypothetical protein